MPTLTPEPTTLPEGVTGRLAASPKVTSQLVVSSTLSASSAPLRVALVGQAGSGKTTQAQLLRDRFKGDLLHFAGPLKKLTQELYGAERLADERFARTAYQEMGAMARRLAPTVWIEKLTDKVSETRNCFVDDCRYINEYYALRRLGFIVIKLIASPSVLSDRRPSMTTEQWQHESERDIAFIHSDAFFSSEEVDEQELHQQIVTWLKEYRAMSSAQ